MSQPPDASVSTQPLKLTRLQKRLPKFSQCKKRPEVRLISPHALVFRINVDFQPNINCLGQSWQPFCFCFDTSSFWICSLAFC